jgi:hypothetical protein
MGAGQSAVHFGNYQCEIYPQGREGRGAQPLADTHTDLTMGGCGKASLADIAIRTAGPRTLMPPAPPVAARRQPMP